MATETQIVVDIVLPDRRHSQGKIKPPLSSYTLALLKAQMPKLLNGCPVVARVHDEQVDGPYVASSARPDVLFLTFLTTGAPRAYAISGEATRTTSHAGAPIKIVHGGVHATSLPRESLLHANIAVRGEVPPKFQDLILQRALDMDPGDREMMRLDSIPQHLIRPPADWSWMKRRNYILAPVVQTSSGCPFHCEFCSVTEVFGAAMRTVPEENLRQELAGLPRGAFLPVIDDNFLQGIQPMHIKHCMDAADVLHEMGFKWGAELTVRTLIEAQAKMAKERPGFDLVGYFAERGCMGFFFGIETIADNGAGLSKSKGADETLQLIRHCHSHGMSILGAFVFGVGADETPDYAKRLVHWAIEDAQLEFAQFSINTPMPGARNFLTGIRDGRVFEFDWELYDAEHCVMHHPRMSPGMLEEIHQSAYKQFYSYRSIVKRTALGLLAFRPGLFRRLKISTPVNFLLHRSNVGWNNRLAKAPPHMIVPDPGPEVWAHVQEALEPDPSRPGDLFNLKVPSRAQPALPDKVQIELVGS